MHEPFSDLGKRVTVSSDEAFEKPFYEHDTSLCPYCGALSIPIKYLGKLVTYFICTNMSCQAVQPNLEHPIFKTGESQQIDSHDLTNRRTNHSEITTKRGSDESPEDKIELVSEKNLRTQIRKGSIIESMKPDLRSSVFEDTAELNMRTKNMADQIEGAINRSLNRLHSQQREKEIYDKTKVREMSRR